MPDYTVSADVDSMLRSANDAAIRSAIGVGQTDAPTLAGLGIQSQTDGAHTFRVRNIAGADLITINTSTRNVTIAGDAYNFSTASGNFTSYNSGGIAWSDGSTATSGTLDLFLRRDAAGILAQRNGTAKQTLRIYNTYTSASIYERAVMDWNGPTPGNLQIGTEFLGSGSGMAARPIDFVTGGVVRMSIAGAGGVNISGTLGNAQLSIRNTSDPLGAWVLSAGHPGVTNGRLGIGHGASIYVSIIGPTEVNPGYFGLGVSSPTERLDVNGNIKSSGNIKGKITTETAYTATTVVATGYITLYDSTGTAYRVPCAV